MGEGHSVAKPKNNFNARSLRSLETQRTQREKMAAWVLGLEAGLQSESLRGQVKGTVYLSQLKYTVPLKEPGIEFMTDYEVSL